MLKIAEHAVGRLEAGLDRQKLLLKRPASIRCNLNTSLPSCTTVSLDGLVGGNRVAGKLFCAKKKEIKQVRGLIR